MKPKKIAGDLRTKIESALTRLLDGEALNAEEKEDLRKNCDLAIKWEGVKQRGKDEKWGSAFANGKASDEAQPGDDNDE